MSCLQAEVKYHDVDSYQSLLTVIDSLQYKKPVKSLSDFTGLIVYVISVTDHQEYYKKSREPVEGQDGDG